MKALASVLEAREALVLREFELPRLNAEDGLLQVELAGICQTDVHLFRGKTTYAPYPLILGHEILGRVAAVGDRAAATWGVQEGDRVVVEATIRCGHCAYCLDGDPRFCISRRGYGTYISAAVPPHLWGSYAQYMYLSPGTTMHRIPDDMPAGLAVLINVIVADGIQWAVLDGGIRLGDLVIVQGVGPLGLACIAAARESGAAIVVATGLKRDEARLALARDFGAHDVINVETEDVVTRASEIFGGGKANVVVDVTGSPQGLAAAVDLVGPRGTIVNCGVTGDETLTPLPMDRLLYKAATIRSVYASTRPAVQAAIELARSRRYPFERLVTHTFGLHDADDAIRMAAREVSGTEPLKVTINPQMSATSSH